jgi:hypothetical protein
MKVTSIGTRIFRRWMGEVARTTIFAWTVLVSRI